MAVARGQGQGGVSAIHVWLIVFVALWLTSTVLLVILYLDQEERTTRADDLQTEVQKLISPAGRRLPQFTEAKPPRTTVVDLLEEDRVATAELAGGTDEPPEMIRTRLREQIEKISGDSHIQGSSEFEASSYDEALELLFDQFQTVAGSLDESGHRADRLRTELAELREAQEQQKSDFEEHTQSISQKIDDIDQAGAESVDKHVRQIEDFNEQLRRVNEQCSDDIQALRNEKTDVQREYDELLARYQGLKDRLGQAQITPVARATARLGDGVVMKAAAGDEVVYINLGRQDHLTLGLEFAVYDSLTGIPESGRAKARIEVVRLHDKSSECRIARLLSNSMIVAGDIIANPIFDRHRTLRFFVLGEFSLDGKTRSDADGAQRIVALIEHWGGKVEDQPSAQVDFVVLGTAPPVVPRTPELEADEDTRYQASQRDVASYKKLLATVQTMSIPVLPQGVFLNFLGYTGADGASF